MKTYKEFVINESVARFLVKGVARQLLKNKGLAKAARKAIPSSAPKQLKFGKTFHGTTKKASDSISKGGWRTDTNVTRQMSGSKVYTAGDNYSAAHYAVNRASKLGDKPAMRQFRVPQSVMQKQTQGIKGGAGDYSGKGYKMTTLSSQQANRYDVTDKVSKSKFDLDVLMSPEKKKELRRRVKAGLNNPLGRKQLRREMQAQKIKEGNKLVNVRTDAGVTRGIDPSTGEYRIIKRRSPEEQKAIKNPKGFEMY